MMLQVLLSVFDVRADVVVLLSVLPLMMMQMVVFA